MRGIWVLALAVAVSVSCGSAGGPANNSERQPASGDSSVGAVEAGYEISDVMVEAKKDSYFWALTFDARWIGPGPPTRMRCVWQMRNAAGEVLSQGAVVLERAREDDRVAGRVYPDEIPGQPVSGRVRC